LGDIGIDRRIILKLLLKKYVVRMWTGIHLAQNTAQWRAVVNTVMNLQVI
jgi:hypothetical protein